MPSLGYSGAPTQQYNHHNKTHAGGVLTPFMPHVIQEETRGFVSRLFQALDKKSYMQAPASSGGGAAGGSSSSSSSSSSKVHNRVMVDLQGKSCYQPIVHVSILAGPKQQTQCQSTASRQAAAR